jgi:hypothetical protein
LGQLKYTLSNVLLFQKRSKSVSSASQKVLGPGLGEADPGGLGACPQQKSTLSDKKGFGGLPPKLGHIAFFFSRRQKRSRRKITSSRLRGI